MTACSDGEADIPIALFSKQKWRNDCAVLSAWGLRDCSTFADVHGLLYVVIVSNSPSDLF